MELHPQAVSLARALLALSRAKQTGTLHVASSGGPCRWALVEGTPRAVEGAHGASLSLGDALLQAGELDPRAHRAALEQRRAAEPDEPAAEKGVVGHWLVEQGLVSRPAVERALQHQLRARWVALLECRELDYRFVPGTPVLRVPWIERPVAAADLVLHAMYRVLAVRPWPELGRLVEGGTLGLTGRGRALLQEATMAPDEAALARALARGASLPALLHAGGRTSRVMQVLASWSLLGAIAPLHRPLDGRYGLLLRKVRQLRQRDGAHAMLDLEAPVAASEVAQSARRALRGLATRVHPDSLGPGARPELQRTCHEVMSALLQAERQLAQADHGPKPRLA